MAVSSTIFRSCAFAWLALCLSVAPEDAFAHSGLARSSPPAGSTVAAPKEIVLFFTEKLEPKFSSVEVRDAKNIAVQAGEALVAPDDRTQMRIPLKPLPAGTYKVIWRVLSVDTHRSRGSFTFRVAP